MGILKVTTKPQLKSFILFPKHLYKKDSNYACDNFNKTYKSLAVGILKKKDMTALIYEKGNQVLGRILYQFKYLEGRGKVCYFSHLDFIDNDKIITELINYMENDMKSMGISYLYGPYFDEHLNKNLGILVQGFDFPPMIYNGYNFEYYSNYLENLNFNKTVDFLTLHIEDKKRKENDIKNIINMINRRHNIKITNCKELKDPSRVLKSIFNEDNTDKRFLYNINERIDFLLKNFDPELFIVALDGDNGEGLGACICIPDLNEILINRKGLGKSKVSKIHLKKLKSVKILHMSVISKYQQTELPTYLYVKTIDLLRTKGIKTIEVGSISEQDTNQMKPVRKVGGEISHIYRIYEKEIEL